jgi:hypothetical protein
MRPRRVRAPLTVICWPTTARTAISNPSTAPGDRSPGRMANSGPSTGSEPSWASTGDGSALTSSSRRTREIIIIRSRRSLSSMRQATAPLAADRLTLPGRRRRGRCACSGLPRTSRRRRWLSCPGTPASHRDPSAPQRPAVARPCRLRRPLRCVGSHAASPQTRRTRRDGVVELAHGRETSGERDHRPSADL